MTVQQLHPKHKRLGKTPEQLLAMEKGREHGRGLRCHNCGTLEHSYRDDDGKLWLWCGDCKHRWRWHSDTDEVVFKHAVAKSHICDVVSQYEDVTPPEWTDGVHDERMGEPVSIANRHASLSERNREYDSRPLCPELEILDSVPVVGVCPECGLSSGYLKIGIQTWCYCEAHKTRWHAENSRSIPRDRPHDEAAWKANAEKLSAYQIVDPQPCGSLTRFGHAMLAGQERDREGLVVKA